MIGIEPPRIEKVFVFGNGMVMVFDQYGRQFPQYQGMVEDVIGRIDAVFDGPYIAAQWPRDWPLAYHAGNKKPAG